tara:strand:+ start:759 stop:929 length:171 start_codon:yes stop_codon:yes gene_type:complete
MSIVTPQKMAQDILKIMDEIVAQYPEEERENLKTVMLGQLGMAMFNGPIEEKNNDL